MTECDHPILENMSIPIFDTSRQIDKNQIDNYQKTLKINF